VEDIEPAVVISQQAMPQFVPAELYEVGRPDEHGSSEVDVEPRGAVALYHQLKHDFGISHTEMGNWLGVKRRTLYNWMKDPERSKKYGPQIEERLAHLRDLRSEMEPEHRAILFKIAFSPIYGDSQFGAAIVEGANSETLVAWYDELYSQFESYRSLHVRDELAV
jgi:DNA-binding XRE family transcriptional regulator